MHAWLQREPGLHRLRDEARRLARRARAAWWIILPVAVLGAAAVAWLDARRVPRHTARIAFRLEEERLRGRAEILSRRDLESYLVHGLLTKQRLLEVMRRRGLLGAQQLADPTTALEAMSRNLKVEIFRDYFLDEEIPEEAPRSARITLHFTASAPQLALDVVRDIGQVLLEQKAAARKSFAEALVRTAARVAERERAALGQLRKERTRRVAELAQLPADGGVASHRLRTDVAHLTSEIDAAEQQVREAERRLAAAQLGAGLERQRLTLQLHPMDDGIVDRPWLTRRESHVLFGLGAFFGLLFAGAVAAGLLDTRVYLTEDLRRLGLGTAGHLPPFKGMDRHARLLQIIQEPEGRRI
ncbi:MAG: hypothetical protein IT371_12340 [Deltaproteobacteria bacterium]|nr:hypothetical protein [Deltaproteobacteria bacterium]